MNTIPAITVINTKAVIDGTGAKPLENATVIVEGSTIKAVERRAQTFIPEGPHVKVLDFPEGSPLPGPIPAGHRRLQRGHQVRPWVW